MSRANAVRLADARPAVPQVPAADPVAGERRAARVGRVEPLLQLSGEQGGTCRRAAGEGGRGGIPHRAVHAADRAAACLRVAAAARRRRARGAARRVPEAAAPGSRGDRRRADRPGRPGADRRVAARDGRDRLGQGPLAGARVHESAARQALVRAGLLPQGDRAVHDDRDPLERRRAGDGRRRQPQVHLGRRVADQGGGQGQGVRRGRERLPRRRSGHRARAAQDGSVGAPARQGGARRRHPGRARDRVRGSRRQAGADRRRADLDARLGGLRRAARGRGVREAQRVDPAHRAPAPRGPRDLGARRARAGARHGAPDPHAAGGCAAHRRGTARPRDRRAHRRRARSACRPVQPHDGAAARVVRGSRAQGRGAHRRAQDRARAADGDQRDPARDLGIAHRRAAGARGRRRAGGTPVRRAVRARDDDRGRLPPRPCRVHRRAGRPRHRPGTAQAHVDHGPRRRRPDDGALRRRAGGGRHRVPGRPREHPQLRHPCGACRSADAGEHRVRRHLRLPVDARTVLARPGRADRDVRAAGGDRDRQRAPVQRDEGRAGAADRDQRDPAGHLGLADRRASGAEGGGGARRAHLRGRRLAHPPAGRQQSSGDDGRPLPQGARRGVHAPHRTRMGRRPRVRRPDAGARRRSLLRRSRPRVSGRDEDRP